MAATSTYLPYQINCDDKGSLDKNLYIVIQNTQEKLRKSVTNGDFGAVESEILENYEESLETCESNFFDKPINKNDVKSLLDILFFKLSLNCITPKVFADPRGYIGLEWISKQNDRLVIVPKGKKLIYAFSIGELKEHGEVSIYNGIPRNVIEKIANNFSCQKENSRTL